MYLSHFGLDEPPFRITPHTEFFFSGANRGATLDALIYAITRDEGIVKVSGEVGSGKTMLCRVLIERLPQDVETVYLANPSLSRDEILHAIAEDLHVAAQGVRSHVLIRALQEHLVLLYGKGRRVVLLIDEAHAMPAESLEEVRLLSNLESNHHKLLQIALFGQPELDAHLAEPSMRQLRERITHSFRLEPLVRADVSQYIDFRMRAAGYRGPNPFSAGALRLIAGASEGLTRRINILADKSLLAAFADGAHEVTPKHARAAIKDAEFAGRRPRSRGVWIGLAGVAAGIALAIGGMRLASPPQAPAPPATASPTAAPASTPPSAPSASPVAPTAATTAATPPSAVAPPGAASPEAPAAKGSESSATAAAQTAPAPPASQADGPPERGSAPAAATSAGEAAPDPRTRPESGASDAGSGRRGTAPGASTASGPPSSGAPQAPAAKSAPQPGRAPAALPAGSYARERYLATQAWFRTAPGNHYSIQLGAFPEDEVDRMDKFLRRVTESLKSGDVYVYSVQIEGRQHFRVAQGDFASVEAAITAMGDLPDWLKAVGPFHRSVGYMRRLDRGL